MSLFSASSYADISESSLATFREANTAYREGNFDRAASLYRELAAKYPDFPDFYYNLGNSLFRMNRPGEAILAYERARLESPRDSDILHNLNYANGLLEYHMEDQRSWYIKTADKLLSLFHEYEIYVLLLAVYALFAGTWLFSFYFRRGHAWSWPQKFFGILLIVSALFAAAKGIDARVVRDAIVISKEAEVRYGPSLSDQVAFRLGEGLKVHVIESRKDWSRVLLVNGESGWVRNKDIKKVLGDRGEGQDQA